ncbi:hypothetical protein C5Y96_09195 [Blastopirellula marina]|uniref:Uncharacterized protein n=1 Tax=Blastopirellula marina TaxID=124 RepID=A0A2S8FVF5_9BACT|nr:MULTISPECIES: hypothetical protein [Pirellulaceae]PQO35814.1 hypothetical protein C5Y96_09195 [Blastopirellula marina]RCS53389.1 hypothetical protein DTL36_09205 [Bremerella cremea]
MSLPEAILKAFPPSEDRLFEILRPAVDNDMLKDIAMADYGHRWEEMYEHLRVIRDRGEIPETFDVQLDEVLCLTRWSDPDKPNPPPFRPGPSGERGFVTRLFACALLMRQKKAWHEAWGCDVAISVASAARIGPDYDEALARYFTHRLGQTTSLDDRSFTQLGLLAIGLRHRIANITEHDFEELADLLLDAQSGSSRLDAFDAADPRPDDFSVQQGFWEPTIAQLNDQAAQVNPKLGEKLLLCTLLVARG